MFSQSLPILKIVCAKFITQWEERFNNPFQPHQHQDLFEILSQSLHCTYDPRNIDFILTTFPSMIQHFHDYINNPTHQSIMWKLQSVFIVSKVHNIELINSQALDSSFDTEDNTDKDIFFLDTVYLYLMIL